METTDDLESHNIQPMTNSNDSQNDEVTKEEMEKISLDENLPDASQTQQQSEISASNENAVGDSEPLDPQEEIQTADQQHSSDPPTELDGPTEKEVGNVSVQEQQQQEEEKKEDTIDVQEPTKILDSNELNDGENGAKPQERFEDPENRGYKSDSKEHENDEEQATTCGTKSKIGVVLLIILIFGILMYFNNTNEKSGPAVSNSIGTSEDNDNLDVFVNTTRIPSKSPSTFPTVTPTISGVPTLSNAPSDGPSNIPSQRPTVSSAPSLKPSSRPSTRPTTSDAPSDGPSTVPSSNPTISNAPTDEPSMAPSGHPTMSDAPSDGPSTVPSSNPSAKPTRRPTSVPSRTPSQAPTDRPTKTPTPTDQPTKTPTPSEAPSNAPSEQPTNLPSQTPSSSPTEIQRPTKSATNAPTRLPSISPTTNPPTNPPTLAPTRRPTREPTRPPTKRPTPSPVPLPDNVVNDSPQAAAFRSYLENEFGVSTTRSNHGNQAIAKLAQEANNGKDDIPLTRKMVQRYAMIVLELALDGNDNLGSFRQDECTWTGIACNNNQEVTHIRLLGKGLDGSIPAEIGLLSGLVHLDLASNNLFGTIPEDLYDCRQLQKMFLYQNRLSGTISERIIDLWNLSYFNLSSNQLTGPIPATMRSGDAGIFRIRQFNVYDNQLTGTIPDGANLRQLDYFDVGRNRLTGTIPASLAEEYVRLRYLYLDHNQFSSTLPSNIVNAGDGYLEILAVNDNQFTGTLPGWHTFITKLYQFTAQNNDFETMTHRTCRLDVMTTGEMAEFKSDCDICVCGEDDQMCKHCYN